MEKLGLRIIEPLSPTFRQTCAHDSASSFVQSNPLHVLPPAFECIKHVCIIQIKEEENRLGPA